jgi:hypothetical protein
VNFGDSDYFLAQSQQDAGAYLSGSMAGKISHRRIFNMSLRRETPGGAFNGLVGAADQARLVGSASTRRVSRPAR